MSAIIRLASGPCASSTLSGTATGYPWEDGDVLYADDLNAAFLPITGGNVTGRTQFFDDWLTPMVNWPAVSSDVISLSPVGKMALTGASHTLGGVGVTSPVAIGVSGFGFNDRPGSNTTAAWGGYFEARQYPDVVSYTQGVEVNIVNVSGAAALQSSPYGILNPFTVALNIQSGGEVSADVPALSASTASAAVWIGDNGARFQTGILFKSTSLVGTDGAGTGSGQAISLATGHMIEWVKPDNTAGPAILSQQTSGASVQLIFDNGAGYLRDGTLGLPLMGVLTGALSSGATSMLLRVNNNAGSSYVPVLIGGPDTGGTGYRMLRVPN